MARGRSAGYEDQRGLILHCAAQLFAQSGYHGTTMNEVAKASGLSKAALYHYYPDKHSLLVSIADAHVSRLHDLVVQVQSENLAPREQLKELIRRIVAEYADAQNAHRVLTEDVKFLEPSDRERILNKERAVVKGFAKAVAALHPPLAEALLATPLTMLLFGMVNWLFTWMRADGPVNYDQMADIVSDLFLGGLPKVQPGAAQNQPHPSP